MATTSTLRMTTRLHTTLNPFHLPPIRYTPFYLLKTALVGVTLFPVRLAVAVLAVTTGLLCSRIASIGADPKTPKPSRARWLLMQPVRLCARAFLWCFGYWWISVDYKAGYKPGARVIVAAPHVSLLDAAVMTWLDLPGPVAKAAVAKMPAFGSLAIAVQSIFVDRKDPDSKHKTVAAIKERATNAAWPPLLIFPEGTCTNGEALITFKPGPFIPAVPVQPVTLEYPFEHVSVSAAKSDAEWRLFLSLFSVYNRLRVTYLPTYSPSDDERHDAALYARNVRSRQRERPDVSEVLGHPADEPRLSH